MRRAIEKTPLGAAGAFPAVVLTGPRRSGKTSLLRHLFPRAGYVLLEDPDERAMVRSDPRGFLDELAGAVVLDVLELTGQVILVRPYFENFGMRIIKSPKVYVGDSGLACHLLGIRSSAELERSPFLGAIFEGFVAAEILKGQVNAGARKEIYYFWDQQGLEVDLLVPAREGELWLIECKAAKTVQPAMAGPLLSLRRSMGKTAARAMVVHRAPISGPATHALAPGIEAIDLEAFVRLLSPPRKRLRRL